MTMLGRMVCLLILVTVVTAMPSNMDAYFCHVPTATISAMFAKSLATVESEFADLLNAVSCTKAYDMFIADFASKCRNFPEIWDVVLEEYELRTENKVEDIALAADHAECGTIQLLVDPAWVAKWKKSDIKDVVNNLRKDVALNVAAIAIIVMAIWARIQTPLLAWWLTNNTTPVVLAIAFAPTATTSLDQFLFVACCSLTGVLVLQGARTVLHRLTTTATALDGTIVSVTTFTDPLQDLTPIAAADLVAIIESTDHGRHELNHVLRMVFCIRISSMWCLL
jgi:hypothetical protein